MERTGLIARRIHSMPQAGRKNKNRRGLLWNGKYGLTLLLPAILLASWQATASIGLISNTLLPSPLEILYAFKELLGTGELISHLQISGLRAGMGFMVGAGLGLLLGILTGFSSKLERLLDPSLQMLRTIPHLAIAPLFILWFGLGEFSKVLLIASGAFFPVYVNTYLGIRGVDSKLFDVARILEFNQRKLITKLILPAALPHVLLGIRLSLGISWLGLVVAEMMGSSEGVGYMILDARQFSQTSVVFVGIIIFAMVGKLSDSVVRVLEEKLLNWRDSYKGGASKV